VRSRYILLSLEPSGRHERERERERETEGRTKRERERERWRRRESLPSNPPKHEFHSGKRSTRPLKNQPTKGFPVISVSLRGSPPPSPSLGNGEKFFELFRAIFRHAHRCDSRPEFSNLITSPARTRNDGPETSSWKRGHLQSWARICRIWPWKSSPKRVEARVGSLQPRGKTAERGTKGKSFRIE